MSDDFAAFILTHGRAEYVKTFNALRSQGYTGKIYFILDNMDATFDAYKQRFGAENIIIFDKEKIAKTFDKADNFKEYRCIIYARNASFEIAKKLGLKNFIQLDDDYSSFGYVQSNSGEYLGGKHKIKNLDKTFKSFVKFLNTTPLSSVAMAQGGDFIGGKDSQFLKEKSKRKVMNSFFCSTEKPFKFIGTINEDVNTYVAKGMTGTLFLTTFHCRLTQPQTQRTPAGMTDFYIETGTYTKSFYTVMLAPSCCKIRQMAGRIHHGIKWNNAVPKIIPETFRKA